ncbi:hypothetical protein [Streptomyces sp. NPDC059788]|uniref:hypothetical protein n=1 Tax=Streptomyces sp. NPDC059788 TaxID=3346948 RepID=UPI0036493B7E
MRASRRWKTMICGVAAVTGIALGTGTAHAVPIGQTITGKLDFYEKIGKGPCGTWINTGAGDLAAVNASLWTAADSTKDELCGLKVTVTYNGTIIDVWVRDKCTSCGPNDLVLSENAFRKIVPWGTDKVDKVEWEFFRPQQ